MALDILSKRLEKEALVVLWMEDDPEVCFTLQHGDGLIRTYLEDRLDERLGNPVKKDTVMEALEYMVENRGRGRLDNKVLVHIEVAKKIRPGDQYSNPE